jgi:hypothetical protein
MSVNTCDHCGHVEFEKCCKFGGGIPKGNLINGCDGGLSAFTIGSLFKKSFEITCLKI